MKTLICGAGPIGRWLALRLHQAGIDVTLLARGRTLSELERRGVVLTDGLTGEVSTARVPLAASIDAEQPYDLAIVPMQKAGRREICEALAACAHVDTVLLMGNDVTGPADCLQGLQPDRVLLGFPGAGGGLDDSGDLVFLDREKARDPRGPVFLGALDGLPGQRCRRVGALLEQAGIAAKPVDDMDGWLKYHFAFVGPTAGHIYKHGGDLAAAADDRQGLRDYVLACRQAGDVLRQVGHPRRQPPIFHLFYWVPLWLAPWVFRKLFASPMAAVGIGLHARTAAPEMRSLAGEFAVLQQRSGLSTPHLDAVLAAIPGGAP